MEDTMTLISKEFRVEDLDCGLSCNASVGLKSKVSRTTNLLIKLGKRRYNEMPKRMKSNDGSVIPIKNDNDLKSLLIKADQAHLISHLESSEDNKILKQLNEIDLEACIKFLNEAKKPKTSISDESIKAPKILTLDQEHKAEYRTIGESAIRQGQVGVVILSGGQGTRLGHNGPKGMFELPLISKKSIFQIHIERIMGLRKLLFHQTNNHVKNSTSNDTTTSVSTTTATDKTDNNNGSNHDIYPSIPIYIMTSDLNDTIIRTYFETNHYFNYPKEDIYFFQQGLLPCFDMSGKIILESSRSLAMAPDGNGGVYQALKVSGAYHDMCTRGVKYLHIYGIDNILIKSCDPIFIGACIHGNIQCGNKSVKRSSKSEKVGLIVNINQRMHVLEYSEIPVHLAESSSLETGELVLTAANICNHFISLEFYTNSILPHLSSTYHIAYKKIPYYDENTQSTITPTHNNGVKLESFIFDIFPLAERWCVMEGCREDEFAPIKNADSQNSSHIVEDSPTSAVVLLSNQAKRWLHSYPDVQMINDPHYYTILSNTQGITSIHKGDHTNFQDSLCEISPLLSYEGEHLDMYTNTTIKLPCYITE